MGDAPGLEACPFCGEELFVSKSGLAIHQGQSQSTCMIGSVGIPVDHRPSVDKWNTRTDHARDKRVRDEALREAAARIDRKIKVAQPEMTRRAQHLAGGKKPGFQYALRRADLDARMSDRDMILALIDAENKGETV